MQVIYFQSCWIFLQLEGVRCYQVRSCISGRTCCALMMLVLELLGRLADTWLLLEITQMETTLTFLLFWVIFNANHRSSTRKMVLIRWKCPMSSNFIDTIFLFFWGAWWASKRLLCAKQMLFCVWKGLPHQASFEDLRNLLIKDGFFGEQRGQDGWQAWYESFSFNDGASLKQWSMLVWKGPK